MSSDIVSTNIRQDKDAIADLFAPGSLVGLWVRLDSDKWEKRYGINSPCPQGPVRVVAVGPIAHQYMEWLVLAVYPIKREQLKESEPARFQRPISFLSTVIQSVYYEPPREESGV